MRTPHQRSPHHLSPVFERFEAAGAPCGRPPSTPRGYGARGHARKHQRGKLADLVIFDVDPLADIRNVRPVYRAVKGGVVYDLAALLRDE